MQKKFTSIFVLLAAMFLHLSALAQGGRIYSVLNPTQNIDLSLSDDKYYVLKNGGKNSYLAFDGEKPTLQTNLDYRCVVQLIRKGENHCIRQVSTGTYYQGFSEVGAPLTLGEEETEYTITSGFSLESPETNGTIEDIITNGNFFLINNGLLLHQDANNPVLGADPKYNGVYSQWSIWEVELEDGTETYSPFVYPKRITDVNDLSESDYYILKNYGNKRYICSTPDREDRPLGFKETPDYSCIVSFIFENDEMYIKQVSTGKYFQTITDDSPVLLGDKVGYKFDTTGLNNGEARFRLKTGGNFNLNVGGNDVENAHARGWNGTGDYSQWEIYKVSNTLLLSEDEAAAGTIGFNHGGTYNVGLSYRIKEDFNTVVLPFDLTAGQVETLFGEDAVVYDFSDMYDADTEEVVITFSTRESGDIEANTPVLVKATRASESNTIANVTIESSDDAPAGVGNYFDFTGVYSPETVPQNSYLLNGSTLDQSAGETGIKPFHAYLKWKGENEGPGNGNSIPTVRLNIDGIVTGIDRIAAAKAESDIIYNLFGQRVTKVQKGIYIVNGKKVIVE